MIMGSFAVAGSAHSVSKTDLALKSGSISRFTIIAFAPMRFAVEMA